MLEAAAVRVGLEIFVRSFLGMRPPDRVMRQLAGVMREMDVPAGTVLFERGTPPTELFMIQRGVVALTDDAGGRWLFEDQSFIGVVDAMQRRPHKRTATVEERVVGAKVSYADYLDVLEDNFDFAKGAMERGCALTHETALRLAPDNVFGPASRDEVLEARGDDSRPLEMVERLMVLNRSRAFATAPVQPLVTLATLAVEERWSAGDVIFERGGPMTSLRIVATGHTEAYREDPIVKAGFGPGDLIGGVAAIGSTEYQYTLTASRPTRTLRLVKEDLFDVMEDHFGVAQTMFEYNAVENERIQRLLAAQPTATLDLTTSVT